MVTLNVIVCALNEEKNISRCLISLINTIESNNIDNFGYIYVINNSSTDNTINIVNNFVEKYSIIKLITIERSTLSFSRNTYKKTIDSKYVAYIDGDGSVDTDWINLVYKYIELDYDVIAGYVKDYQSDNIIWKLFYSQKTIGEYVMGANMVFKRSLIDSINGFPELFNSRGDESGLLSAIKCAKKNYKSKFIYQLIAYNTFSNNLFSYIRDLFNDSRRHYILDYLYSSNTKRYIKMLIRMVICIAPILLFFNMRICVTIVISIILLDILRNYKIKSKQIKTFMQLTYRKIHILSPVILLLLFIKEFISSYGYNYEYLKTSILKVRSNL